MHEISIELLGLVLCLTIFLSMLLMPVTISLAQKIGAIDIPKCRSSHTTPKPRMGGLAMSSSLLIVCLVFLSWDIFIVAFLSGLIVIVVTGIVDDMIEIPPFWKLMGQILAASLFVNLSGIKIEHIGDILGIGDIVLGEAAFAFTVFFLVGTINAFNFSDGLDSLAGGISVIASAIFGYFAWRIHEAGLLIIAISLIGSIVGFLRYNSYPTRVFMGDSGSMMLGYTLAVMLISLSYFSPQLPVSALAMVVALPLLDTLLVMTRRIFHKRNPFHSDRTHIHHRLIDLGLSHPAAVMTIYIVMFGLGLLGIALHSQPDWVILSSLAGAGLLIFACISFARRSGVRYSRWTSQRLDRARKMNAFKFANLWLRGVAQPVDTTIFVALLLPTLFASLLALSGSKVLVLYCVAMLLVFLSFRTRRAADQSILHGTLFLNIFALVLIYNLSALTHSSWLDGYIGMLSVFALLWTVLRLFFTKYSEILFVSDFELLILLISWFVAFVVMEDLPVSLPVLQAVQNAFLLSLPFMLVMKVNISNRNQKYLFSIPLIAALVIVVTRAAA